MLQHINLENILVLDIETVSDVADYSALPDNFRQLWDTKVRKMRYVEQTPEEFYKDAAIYAEFGKIICISVGATKVDKEVGNLEFRIKSFYGDEEKNILEEFITLLNNTSRFLLCGHNAKEFDFPYLCRRMLINGLELPKLLDISGKKPWEVPHLDTMELWKFGDYKSYTSLNLLAAVFGIPTPKDDMDGSQVGEVYWKDKDLDRIVKYCQKDVVTVMQLLLKLKGMPLLEEEQITYAE